MTVERFLNDLEVLDGKQATTQKLVDEALAKNDRLAVLMETYRLAQEKREGEIEERSTRLNACAEIRAELVVLIPRIEKYEDERGDAIWAIEDIPREYSRWKALVDDFNRVYYARGARLTSPMDWSDTDV